MTRNEANAAFGAREFEAWVRSLRFVHMNQDELDGLIGRFDKNESLRALAHLELCPLCSDRLIVRIEEAVLDDQGVEENTELLLRFLQHEESVVRAAAARAAATLAFESPEIPQSLTRLLSDDNELVRVASAEALAQFLTHASPAARTPVLVATADALATFGASARTLAEKFVQPVLTLFSHPDETVVGAGRRAVEALVSVTFGDMLEKLAIRPWQPAAAMAPRRLDVSADTESQTVSVQEHGAVLRVHVSRRDIRLAGIAVQLFAGSRPIGEPQLLKKCENPDFPEWVEAWLTIGQAERRATEVEAVLRARVVLTPIAR